MEHNTNHNNSKFGGFEQVFQSLLRDLISKSNKDDDAVIGNITKKNCVHLLEEEEPIVIESTKKTIIHDIPTQFDLDGVFHYVQKFGIKIAPKATELKENANSARETVEYEQLFTAEERLHYTPLPTRPYYKELSKMIRLWAEKEEFPIKFIDLVGFNEVQRDSERLVLLTPTIVDMSKKWNNGSDEDKMNIVQSILETLNIRGLMTLMRQRWTPGSMNTFPPSWNQLLYAFNQPHDERTKLSVGARALSKHSGRSSEQFWPSATGPELAQNKKAEDILRKIMRDAQWINIHWLPHDVFIFEVRNSQSYGARWTADGKKFRGFLEPQMEGGHEVGWKH
jgi:hypothetical protein